MDGVGAGGAGGIVMIGAGCVGMTIGGIVIGGMVMTGAGAVATGAALGAVVKVPTLTGPWLGSVACTDQK